jgi:hypothetical protein
MKTLITKDDSGNAMIKDSGKRTPVAKMTHQAVALAFCKECRGWTEAEYTCDNHVYSYTKAGAYLSFDATKLSVVMPAVREWLSATDAYESEQLFDDVLSFSFGSYFLGVLEESEICHDLLATCVEAKRNL